MKAYDFEAILAAGTDMTEELADQLFEAGCDDGTPGVCRGVPVIGFSREAECLESAIRSAVADVQKNRLRCRASPDRARLTATVLRRRVAAR